MQRSFPRARRAPRRLVAALAVALVALATAAQASAVPPWDGSPISPGLGPTYGEPWCASPAGEPGIAPLQGPPLALIPFAAIECSLQKFQAEATAAGIPQRMTYSRFGTSSAGHPMWVAVVNALETPQQQRDFQRWQQLRAIEKENPTAALALLATWGNDVKMPIFIEANIHGGEREGADAMMQALRDLTTTPRGAHPTIDKILDNSILIVVPSQNPDGRIAGTRANSNGFDMNRDFLVQSQSETKASIRLQQQWLATNGLALHGYYNPTLIDALTKPHNPGIEYDIFVKWNQNRVDRNEADFVNIVGRPGSTGYGALPGSQGYVVQRPVNDWCSWADVPHRPPGTAANPYAPNCDASGTPPGPAVAEGWDDWGPFYTQTYISLIGIDGSTVEMCSSSNLVPTYRANGALIDGAGCGGEGRLGSKKAQYVAFYSSADYWLSNKLQMMTDRTEIYRRGVANAPRPLCCANPDIAARGFDEANHNWMVEYPRAYVIPRDGGGQRSNAEANRLVQWLLDNGIKVERANASFTWDGQTYPAGSYVVYMNQALRGLALTALSAGQDVSDRIHELYAPPGAWSHGLLWGADTVEIPRGAAFAPATTPITEPAPLQGGVRGGTSTPADWYSVTLRGPSEVRAILQLLREGHYAELAEAPFTSTTGGLMPAGTLIFRNAPATVAALQAAGQAAGIWFERNVGVAKPPRTRVMKAPKIAILVNTATRPFPRSDQSESLRAIFGSDDIGFVSTVSGADSLQNAATNPLAGYDVIYNTGQAFPSTANATARERLNAFFARGGGYIGTSVSGTNFTFLSGGGLTDTFTQASQSAYGGIAVWDNVGGAGSPLTGGYPARDTLYLPSNITYFNALPTGAVVDGRYRDNTSNMFIAGLWRDRSVAVPGSPVIVHGNTTVSSRYMGLATNPFSRQDAEREWTLIGQAALWSTLTDEIHSSVRFPQEGGEYGPTTWAAGCSSTTAAACGTAAGPPGPAVASVQVALQQASTGLWWNGTAFASGSPVYENATGTASWTYGFASSRFSDGEYVLTTRATDVGGNVEIGQESTRFLFDGTPPVIDLRVPGRAATYAVGQNVRAQYECSDALSGLRSCTGPVESGQPLDTSPGTHLFTVVAVDEAGNRTTQTVSYTVAAMTCTVAASGRPVAGRTGVLNLRLRAFGPDRAAAQPMQRVRFTLRGAGIKRAVNARPDGTARVTLRPRTAGTIQVRATGVEIAGCSKNVRVRPGARAGTGGAPSLTGRP